MAVECRRGEASELSIVANIYVILGSTICIGHLVNAPITRGVDIVSMEERRCCLSPEDCVSIKFKHEEKEVYAALGLSKEEAERVNDMLIKMMKEEKLVSRVLEKIWDPENCDLPVNQRIYATFRLGVEVYNLVISEVLAIVLSGGEGVGQGKAS